MSDENKQNPAFKIKDMQLDEEVIIKLVSPSPIASGNSKFGGWRLRLIEVTNRQVHNRDNSTIQNYTGEAVMFPSDKLEEKLMKSTNGTNENVVVKLTKKAKTTERGGLYTDYDVDVIDGGSEKIVNSVQNPFLATTPTDGSVSDLNSVEQKFVADAQETTKQTPITMEQFVQAGKVTYNVKEERAKEIWEKHMK